LSSATDQLPQLTDLLLHRPPMLLLDEILEVAAGHAASRVVIGEDSQFFQPPQGVPSWISIEYMAQTVGLIAGVEARLEGDGVPTGYLLGTRRFTSRCQWYGAGTVLEVHSDEEFVDDNGLGAYNCHVTMAGEQVAACRLTVYRRPQEGAEPG
jgi:predicted hotdog family 3-hydroxylacyl-ACP dehydratase